MIEKFTVTPEEAGERLDKYLVAKTALSRSYVQKLVEDSSRKVKAGEVIEIEIPESKPLDLTPYELELDVAYEDSEMLVVNKPAGLTVHPAAGNWEKTLVHALLHHCKGKLSGINGVERPGIVHRLDKDTSGLMVVAKTDSAHKRLAAQIESREIKRSYYAIVNGVPNPTSEMIKTGFGRHPKDRKKMTTFDLTEAIYGSGGSGINAAYNKNGEIELGFATEYGMERGEGKSSGAKVAVTYYEVKQVLGRGLASIVECNLETGRTHQIRVHMKHIKYPIIGDQVYGVTRKNKLIPEFPRQALHAHRLEIPDVGVFEAEMPEDMQLLIKQLDKN